MTASPSTWSDDVGGLAVLVSGSGSNLGAILAADLPVCVVVSNRRDAYALQRAADAGVPTEYVPLRPVLDAGRTRRDYDADLADVVARHDPAFVVLAGWMHVLSSAFLDRFPDRVVNLHPALPGTVPGAHGIADAFAAFERGETDHTGVMVHLVPDERVDEGPVLATAVVPIEVGDTVDTLTERMHATEHVLLVDTLRRLLAGGA